ncbi:MAG TPA: hypothetical protein VF597_01555 [Candidatus Saccharimonadales bacterium]|jgi:hypothetical protein
MKKRLFGLGLALSVTISLAVFVAPAAFAAWPDIKFGGNGDTLTYEGKQFRLIEIGSAGSDTIPRPAGSNATGPGGTTGPIWVPTYQETAASADDGCRDRIVMYTSASTGTPNTWDPAQSQAWLRPSVARPDISGGCAPAAQQVIASPTDAEDTSEGGGGEADEGPACSAGALGWVICPAMKVMSDAVQWMASALQSYLSFNPFKNGEGGESTELKKLWTNILNISNLLLIAAFLFTIFSQATSVGLSKYGVKRILPRIFGAAILMNLSYYICQVLVDISNVAGVGVTQFVSAATGTTFADSVTKVGNFSQLVVGTGIIAIIAFFFFMPVLLSFLAIFLTIAARNAIIVLLVVVAPLAFIAWTLPNTEKYFRKWWETLINMLLLFPATMLVFSVSIVASNIISVSNPGGATGELELNGIIALLVLAMPLFALPFLFKVAGSGLSRINAMTNQQLNRGANSAPIKATRDFTANKAKQYGKFTAFGIGAGIGKTAGKAADPNSSNLLRRGLGKSARAVGQGYTNVRSFDKAVETSLQARRQGRQDEIQEQAARLGNKEGLAGMALKGVGGSRYSEIAAEQVETNFAKRVKSIRARFDQEGNNRTAITQALVSAIETNDGEEATAAIQQLSKAGGAGGREALTNVLKDRKIDNPELRVAINNAIQRDSYGDLVGKRGDVAKGGFDGDGVYRTNSGVTPLGTKDLASQDFATLRDNFDSISAQQAQAILSNPALNGSVSDEYARATLRVKAEGGTTLPPEIVAASAAKAPLPQQYVASAGSATSQQTTISQPAPGQTGPIVTTNAAGQVQSVVNSSVTNVESRNTTSVTAPYGDNLNAFDAAGISSLINNSGGGVNRLSNTDLAKISQRVKNESAPEFQQINKMINDEGLRRGGQASARRENDAAYNSYNTPPPTPPPNGNGP